MSARQSLLGVFLVVAALGCESAEPEPFEPVRPVKLFAVGPERAAAPAEYPGVISPAQNAEIGFEVPGRIVGFTVIEGQDVEEGEILARVDARDYEAGLASARADLEKAEADDRRGRSLFAQDPGAIERLTLDSYRRALGVAEAAYRTSEKALDDTRLRAPFAGVVARKLVSDFANVQAKEPVLVIQDNSHLEIEVNVPEQDIASAERELSIDELNRRTNPFVVVTSLPERQFPARIIEFSTMADPVTRTFRVTLSFARPEVQVLPGMTAKAIVRPVREGVSGIWIPAKAVLGNVNGGAYVWVLDPPEMRVHRAFVTLGTLSGDLVQILDGIESGVSIAESGVHHLRENMQIARLED